MKRERVPISSSTHYRKNWRMSLNMAIMTMAATCMGNTADAGLNEGHKLNSATEVMVAPPPPPTPFDCNATAFVSQGSPTTLAMVNTNVTPYTFTNIPLSPAGMYTFNAIAMNPLDGFIYAWSDDEELLRIGANGVIDNLGLIPGQSEWPSKKHIAGAFDKDGTFYFKDDGSNGAFRKLAFPGGAPDTVQILAYAPSLTRLSDCAYNLFDDKLYGMVEGTNELGILDPNTAISSTKSTSGLPNEDFGTAWIDGLNRLFISSSVTGNVYRIDDLSAAIPAAVLVSGGPSSMENDGTACGCVPIISKTVNPTTTFAGATVTYTYEIGIAFSGIVSIDFEDDLRSVDDFAGTGGIDESATPIDGTYIPATFSMTGATGTPVFSNGNQTLNITGLSMTGPVVATISIDVITLFPGSTDTYFNQAKVTNIVSSQVTAPFPPEILSDDPNHPLYPYPTGLDIIGTLPVELVEFKGWEHDCNAMLEWTTGSEQNTSHFALYSSTDGEEFTQLGSVDAVGNSSTLSHYSYTDKDLTRSKYYKLVAVDFDGQQHYSDIILVKGLCEEETTISLYPNPNSTDEIQVLINSETWENGSLSIFDVSGRLVLQEALTSTKSSGVFSADISTLVPGLYHVKVHSEDNSMVKSSRFIRLNQ